MMTPRPLFCIFVVAIAVIALVACGDDGGSTSPSASDSPAGSSSTASPLGGTPDGTDNVVSPDFIDLASADPLFVARTAGEGETVSGGGNVALGDFNGDGETDLLLGAQLADGPGDSRLDAGEAYVIFGPLAGERNLAAEPADITIYGQSAGDNLGFSVMSGDLNDDGTDDIFVGAPGVTAGFDQRTDQGRIYVFYGGDALDNVDEFDLLDDVFDFTVTGAEGFSRLGTTMALGDVNGDGRTDLVSGSPFAGRAEGTPPGSQRLTIGEVYIIYGQEQELTGERNIAALDYDVLIAGDYERGQFANSVAVADFNADGKDDILVGAHRTDPTGERDSGGAAYIFFGDENLARRIEIAKGEADVVILGPAVGAGFGYPVAAGDVNGDSIADVIAGAQTESDGNNVAAGKLRVFYGPDFDEAIDLQSDDADLTVTGGSAGLLIPTSMLVADVNGDDAQEILIASASGGTDVGRSGSGLVYVLRGAPDHGSALTTGGAEFAPTMIGPQPQAALGAAMAIGSIDGTPAIALLVSWATSDDNPGQSGAVYIIEGVFE